MNIQDILPSRILILDGAMGTMIQRYKLTEADYRGERFKDFSVLLKGNNDLLSLTRPDIIGEIHRAYLEAGADIIETNTFNATRVSMSDYHMQEYVREMNFAAARLAREAADEYTAKTPDKPRFVAGSIGPTNKTTSMSPNVEDPMYRALTFDELKAAYREQIEALMEGEVDLLLVETIFDTLNAKAAVFAAKEAMCDKDIPIILSVTLSDKAGRTLSGQTLSAFVTSVSHAGPLAIGLNCSFGAADMKPYLKELGRIAPFYISAYPNAGLPNQLGEYDETPERMAVQIKEYIDEGLVNIVGAEQLLHTLPNTSD
jgi:5-methyltetrahydrofolate--homocysteine methyltransferase